MIYELDDTPQPQPPGGFTGWTKWSIWPPIGIPLVEVWHPGGACETMRPKSLSPATNVSDLWWRAAR